MRILLAILLICSMSGKIETEQDIWVKANQLFKQANYYKAAQTFMQIEDLYPASPKIKDALFLAAKSFLLCKKYKKAIETAELLKELDAPYKENEVDDILIQSYYALLRSPERENPTLRITLALADKHPNKYKKIREKCINILAYSDLKTGLLYAKKDNYIVALKYYRNVIKKYNSSAFTDEAYFRCIEIFNHLGLQTDKNQCIRILALKYPHSQWYKKAIELGCNTPNIQNKQNPITNTTNDRQIQRRVIDKNA